MLKRILLISVILVIALPICAFADIQGDVRSGSSYAKSEGTPVAAVAKNQEAVKAEIIRIEMLVSPQNEISGLTRNGDGTLSSVTYSDGTTANYSDYKYDGSGRIDSFFITSGDTCIKLVKDGDGSASTAYGAHSQEPKEEKSYAAAPVDEPDKGKSKQNPIVIIVPDIEEAARNPLSQEQLNGFRGAVNGLSEARAAAAGEYKKNTEPYYTKVKESLVNVKDGLAAEGIPIYGFLENVTNAASPEAERKFIDEAVQCVYAEAQREEGSRRDFIDAFIAAEKEMREKIIVPEMQIYEGKVEAALQYLYSIIDELMSSKASVFMTAKDEKIEAIINLPKK